jgi:hypothetical protein
MVDTIFNSNTSPNQQPQQQQPQEQPFDFGEFIGSRERDVERQHQYVQQAYEQHETVLFNRREEETKKKIEAIQAEIKKLAAAIVGLDQTVQTTVNQDVVSPGIGHLNLFEKLLSFIRDTRKRVVEARNWAAMQNRRSQAKSYYWKQAGDNVGGTKFSMSHERTVATQTG